MKIRAKIDLQPDVGERRNVATALLERVDDAWRVDFLDREGGRWSTIIHGDFPTPWHVVKAAFDRMPDEEECAVCGRLYRRLLRDGVCGGCRAMQQGRNEQCKNVG